MGDDKLNYQLIELKKYLERDRNRTLQEIESEKTKIQSLKESITFKEGWIASIDSSIAQIRTYLPEDK